MLQCFSTVLFSLTFQRSKRGHKHFLGSPSQAQISIFVTRINALAYDPFLTNTMLEREKKSMYNKIQIQCWKEREKSMYNKILIKILYKKELAGRGHRQLPRELLYLLLRAR